MTDTAALPIEPLETDAEWTAAEVADPAAWTHQLSEVEIAELEAALAHARTVTDEVIDVTRDDFPLDTLVSTLDGIVKELIDGRGFHRIAGLPVERLGPDDSSWIYWGIGRHMGEPWAQNHKGHVLGDVKDQGKQIDDPTARGNELGGHALPFHSDGSDLVGLMCLADGVSGGESLVANAVAAHNALVREDPALAAVLYEGLPYDFRGENADGQQSWYEVPVFTRHHDRLFVRYIRPYIEAMRSVGGVTVLDLQPGRTDFLTQAKEYEALLLEPDVHLALDPEWRMGPGQIPAQVIGSVDASEINAVTAWLDDLVARNGLPPKLVVVHQFTPFMVTNRDQLAQRVHLTLLIHLDGFGSPEAKISKVEQLHPTPPLFMGFKLFLDEDTRLMSPSEVIGSLDPDPVYVSYQ